MKHKIFSLTFVLILFISACNLPSGAQTPTSIESIATQAALTVTAAAQLPLATSSATPDPATSATPVTQAPPQGNVTNTPVCNLASFDSDVTIPDNANINVNAAFVKTWRLRNVGSCAWTSAYQIVFDSGDQMSGPNSQQLTNVIVPPGGTVDVSISLTAPGSAGTYKGNWRLKDANGAVFALSTGPFWVQIKAIAAQPPAANWPTFKNGDTGPEVFAIQHLLRARGYNLAADGIFGPNTQARVEDFQTDNNLTEDAIVGPETWQKLIIQAAQGKTGQEVRAIQVLLKDKFGYNINVDGIFGPDTANAVKDFQADKGIAVDGIVGPQTWRRLISD